MYQAGAAGGGLHSPVAQFHDMVRSHCAELMPGVAITATAVAISAIARVVAKRRTNRIMVGLSSAFPTVVRFSLFR
ncbi:hypothetical protein X011_19070 [Mycobacterium tuberculosis variant microti OV254]|nr:hypothetical protein X011_19070 [Mycobacterium tuberculosis variant microti OV254]